MTTVCDVPTSTSPNGSSDTVFWKRMPVEIIRRDSDQIISHFEVRLMGKRDAAGRFESMKLFMYQEGIDESSIAGSVQGAKLFSAELDGPSFERIRRDEKLLVDYQQFLQNVVGLFERAFYCTSHHTPCDEGKHRAENAHRFRIVLRISGQCKLEFLECNAFRELAHLTLSVQANSDTGMNSFLLFRLREIMEENEALLSTIETLRQDGDAIRQQLSAMHHQRSADTHHYSSETSNLKIQCDMMQSQVSNATEQCDLLKSKLSDMEATNARLHQEKMSKEEEIATLKEQQKRLNDTIDSYKRNTASVQEITLQSSKEITRLKELCDGYKCARDMADARIDDWKRIAKSHEEQAEQRSNTIKALEEKIAQLSRDADHATKALHDTNARSQQREELMQTQEEALKSAQDRVTHLQEHNRNVEQQLETVQKKLETAQKREQEAVQKAQNSEKMIVWLNKQLTSIQLKSPPIRKSPLMQQSSGDIKTPVPATATSRLATTSVNSRHS